MKLLLKQGKGGQKLHGRSRLKKHDGLFNQGRCTFLAEVDCWCYSDCHWVETNLATFIFLWALLFTYINTDGF